MSLSPRLSIVVTLERSYSQTSTATLCPLSFCHDRCCNFAKTYLQKPRGKAPHLHKISPKILVCLKRDEMAFLILQVFSVAHPRVLDDKSCFFYTIEMAFTSTTNISESFFYFLHWMTLQTQKSEMERKITVWILKDFSTTLFFTQCKNATQPVLSCEKIVVRQNWIHAKSKRIFTLWGEKE